MVVVLIYLRPTTMLSNFEVEYGMFQMCVGLHDDGILCFCKNYEKITNVHFEEGRSVREREEARLGKVSK